VRREPAVRPGAKDDVPFVYESIRGLAEFEKLEHLFTGTVDALREHLFGPHPSCELLISRDGDVRTGYALFFTTYSTFLTRPGIFLEDLFVLPAHRGYGHGKALLVELARLAVERGCGRLEWSVLDWNSRAIAFYDSLGAAPVTGWIPYRLDGDALGVLASRRSGPG
jgi:GNAT superfamily N-acetyltransferase